MDDAIIQRLIDDQSGKCATCWRLFDQTPPHLHHAIIPKGHTNYKKFKKWLDMAENLILVCWICHQDHGDLTCYFQRLCFWSDKVNMGYDMRAWLDSIPMRDKEEFIHIGEKKELEG